MKKERLDLLLVQMQLTESREKAKALIMAGQVFVDGQREDKAGSTFSAEALIELRGLPMKYVSRGGFKLEKALLEYRICLADKVCMDVGSSTGGFTDCMLQNGAKKVYAIDVGTNQLVWKLRSDDRVVSMEKTNIRYVTRQDIAEPAEFVSIDVAFISLTKIFEAVYALMSDQAEMVCLIKPQFEAGRDQVGKKGVVRDKQVHKQVIQIIVEYLKSFALTFLHLTYSPIKGPEGNIEYLLHLRKDSEKSGEQAESVLAILEGVVEDAHKNLV